MTKPPVFVMKTGGFGTSCFIGFKQKVSNTNGFCNRQTVHFIFLMQFVPQKAHQKRFARPRKRCGNGGSNDV